MYLGIMPPEWWWYGEEGREAVGHGRWPRQIMQWSRTGHIQRSDAGQGWKPSLQDPEHGA